MRLAIAFLAAVAVTGFAGEAAAQAAQCFNRYGQPYGPVYRMENPSAGWMEWVQRLGGTCRPIAEYERQGFERLPQQYPPDYLAWQARAQPGYRPQGPGAYPGGPGRPGYDAEERDWRGDSYRASFLVQRWLAGQGRPYAQVVDTGRVDFLYERQWRIFVARWNDGSRSRVAVRFSRREGGTYIAMQSYGGGAWGQPQPIGQ
jgi:hypothetical protein